MRNLALELRPRSLDEMVGMGPIVAQIRSQVNSGRIPASWLFTGGFGAGKTTIARILSVSLNCEHQTTFGRPCKACWDLFDTKTFSIQEEDLGSNTSVDYAREIAEHAGLMPRFGKYRIYILDEAQMQTVPAQNSLLKHFENSPESTIWMICTTNPQKIIEGLRGRCAAASYQMPVPGVKEIRDIVGNTLAAAKPQDGNVRPLVQSIDTLVLAIKEAGIVSPRVIVGVAERWMAGGSVADCVFVADPCSINTLGVCKAAEKGDWFKVASLLEAASNDDGRIVRSAMCKWFRNILLRSSSSPIQRQLAADAIHILTDHATFEDGLQLSSTAASLYHICKAITTARRLAAIDGTAA